MYKINRLDIIQVYHREEIESPRGTVVIININKPIDFTGLVFGVRIGKNCIVHRKLVSEIFEIPYIASKSLFRRGLAIIGI